MVALAEVRGLVGSQGSSIAQATSVHGSQGSSIAQAISAHGLPSASELFADVCMDGQPHEFPPEAIRPTKFYVVIQGTFVTGSPIKIRWLPGVYDNYDECCL